MDEGRESSKGDGNCGCMPRIESLLSEEIEIFVHVGVDVYSWGVGVMSLGVSCGDPMLGGCKRGFGMWLGGGGLERTCSNKDPRCWGVKVRVLWSGSKPNGTTAMEWGIEASNKGEALE